MKKRTRNSLIISSAIVIVVLLLLVGFCNRRGGVSGMGGAAIIPDDAAIVLALDLPKILRQIDFNNLQTSDRYQASLTQAALNNPVFAEVLRDPQAAGVNLVDPAFMVYRKNPESPEEDLSTVIFSLSDQSSFEQAVRRATLVDWNNNRNFTSVHLDRLTTVGWDNDYAVFGTADNSFDLDEALAVYFNTAPTRSIASDPTFQQCMEQNGELLFWVAFTPLAGDQEITSKMGFGGVSMELLKDNHVIGNLDFTRGKIDGVAKFLFKKELANHFNNFFNDSFEADFSPFVADRGRLATFFASINLRGIFNYYVSNRGAKEAVEKLLQQEGIDIEEFFRVFGGDLVLVLYQSDETAQPAPILGTRVYRPDRFQSYLDNLVAANRLQQRGQGVYATSVRPTIDSASVNPAEVLNYHLVVQDGEYVFFTNDPTQIQVIAQGGYAGGQQLSRNVTSNIDNNLIYGEMDFTHISMNPEMADWEKMEVSFNKENIQFELILKDKTTNALEKLLQNEL